MSRIPDYNEFAATSPRHILIKARELIADVKHWTRQTFARDKFNLPIGTSHPEATCFCGMGAVRRCGGNMAKADRAIDALIDAVGGDRERLLRVNDYHGHAAILKVFDMAIEKLEDVPCS